MMNQFVAVLMSFCQYSQHQQQGGVFDQDYEPGCRRKVCQQIATYISSC